MLHGVCEGGSAVIRSRQLWKTAPFVRRRSIAPPTGNGSGGRGVGSAGMTPFSIPLAFGRPFTDGVASILAELLPSALGRIQKRFAELDDIDSLFTDIVQLPAPDQGDSHARWQALFRALRCKESNLRFCRGMFLVVLARHIQRETSRAPSLQGIRERLRELVGSENAYAIDTVRCHYYYALAVLEYPGLAALAAGYRTAAQAWGGTLKLRKLRQELPGASGLARLPLPLDESPGFKEAMVQIVADSSTGHSFLKRAVEENVLTAADVAGAVDSLALSRADTACLGPDSVFCPQLAARIPREIPELPSLATIGAGLAVRRSTIPGAGLGLFATRRFRAGQDITFFRGSPLLSSRPLPDGHRELGLIWRRW